MPLYEYVCHTCGDRFERLVRSSNGAIPPSCPTCGADDVTRVFSTFASGGNRNSQSAADCGPAG